MCPAKAEIVTLRPYREKIGPSLIQRNCSFICVPSCLKLLPSRHDILHSQRHMTLNPSSCWSACLHRSQLMYSVIPRVFIGQFLCDRDHYQHLGLSANKETKFSALYFGWEREALNNHYNTVKYRVCWKVSTMERGLGMSG